MATDAGNIHAKVDTLRARNAHRDQTMDEILAIREGRWEEVYPGLFPDFLPKPAVANLIDTAAKDVSEVVAPLPGVDCQSAKMLSDKARKFADKRTKIANDYVDCSNLQVQMYPGADRLLSYGFVAFMVEPDFDKSMPKILVDNTHRAYYQNDPFNRETLFYCRVFRRYLDELAREYPEASARLKDAHPWSDNNTTVEVVRWWDKRQQALMVLEDEIILKQVENKLDKCPVRVVEMPKIGEVPRGQYDDVIWVQAARALAQVYSIQAMDESVNAPIHVPDDVQEFNVGPKELIRTQTPQGVGRVNLQIPNGVFAELQNMTSELRLGTRYPEGRSGQMDASIITGQGVEALMGTFSTQTQTAQLMLAKGLTDVIAMCFDMDEKLWPNKTKTVRGSDHGSPYEVTYKPSSDIKGDHTCDVSYGLTAGLDPNRALVFVLQAQTAGLISSDTAMRELPIDIHVEEERKKINVELLRQASSSAIAGLAQSIPQLAASGMDPSQTVQQISEVIRLTQKGDSMEAALAEVFPPPSSPEEGAPPGAEEGGGGEQQPEPAPGGADLGGGVGQANDLLMSLAGLTPGGDANLQSTVSRRTPIPA